MTKGGGILICFGLFWSAITLLFDYQMMVPAARQLLASRFPSTKGMILSSEVTEHDGEDGPTYGVKLSYSFSVEDQPFIGTRYRYSNFTSGGDWARRVVGRHAPGTEVTVYYDPRNPENCVLRPGIAGSDLFHLAFMTPFNAVMLGFWWFGGRRLWRRWRKPIAGGVKLRRKLRKTHAQMIEFSAPAAGLLTMAMLAFGSIFVVGFGFGGFHPTLKTMTVTWTIILAGGLGVALWHGWKIASGNYDVILDELKGTLQLPRTSERKAVRHLPTSEIHALFVETIAKSDSDGQTTYTYAPSLRLKCADGPVEKLAEWHDEEKAREFVDWLREKLGPRPATHRTQQPAGNQSSPG